MNARTMPWLLLGIIYLLLFLHVSAEVFYLYWILPWFDMLTHFIGGVWIGLAALWLLYLSTYTKPRVWKASQAFWYVILAALIIGGVWELYEVSVHLVEVAPFERGYMFDTCKDLTMDTLGSIVAYLCFRLVRRRA